MGKGISVIMPCYNAGEFIEEAVASILDQKFDHDYEIIVVDDCSGPETQVALNRVEASFGRHNVKVLRLPENKGPSAARNMALKEARYDYILPVDADDRLSKVKAGKGVMHKAFEYMEANPDCIFTYCRCRLFGARSSKWNLPEFNEKKILAANMVPVYAMFRRKEALEVGGYDETLKGLEDWAFWIRMLNNRKKNGIPAPVHRIEEELYDYRQHSHGKNVNNSHGIPLSVFFTQAATNYPEIYRHHYPSLPSFLIPKAMSASHYLQATKRRACKAFSMAAGAMGRAMNYLMTTGRSLEDGNPENVMTAKAGIRTDFRQLDR